MMLVVTRSTRLFPSKQYSVAMVREEKKISKLLYFVSEGLRKAAQSTIRSVMIGSSDIVSTRSKIISLILRAFVSPSVHSFYNLEKIILSFDSL